MATPPVVRKALWDSGAIKSGKDLKGRKVTINAPGDITEYFLTLIMRKYGMTLKDTDVNPLGFADQLVAFRNGAIDAGFLPEPLATTAVMAGSVALLKPDDGIGRGAVTTFVFFGTKFMQDRPNVAIAFLRALLRGARKTQGDYNKNPTPAAMIAKEMDLKPAAVEQSAPYEIDPTLDISK
jgi:ABC-type nitrate/sulfonate/bicarbonate transport system substrate-binding protein